MIEYAGIQWICCIPAMLQPQYDYKTDAMRITGGNS